MTATDTRPDLPAIPPAKPPWYHRRAFHAATAFTAAAAAATLGLVLTAGGGPQTAGQIVAADGYTVAQTYTAGQLPASLSAYATSAAYGTSGADMEVVVVFKQGDDGLVTMVAGVLQPQYPGLTVAANGDELTVSGPEAVFTADNAANNSGGSAL